MDLDEARRRRDAQATDGRDVDAESRASDARLRHGIREAFARQRAADRAEPEHPAPSLRLVPPDRP
jgi:hypothetical protein